MVFEALSGAPSADLPHALRWYNHISSFGDEKARFPGNKKDLQSYGGGSIANGTKKNDDDDFDLFGSDSEEVGYILSSSSVGHCFAICHWDLDIVTIPVP